MEFGKYNSVGYSTPAWTIENTVRQAIELREHRQPPENIIDKAIRLEENLQPPENTTRQAIEVRERRQPPKNTTRQAMNSLSTENQQKTK